MWLQPNKLRESCEYIDLVGCAGLPRAPHLETNKRNSFIFQVPSERVSFQSVVWRCEEFLLSWRQWAARATAVGPGLQLLVAAVLVTSLSITQYSSTAPQTTSYELTVQLNHHKPNIITRAKGGFIAGLLYWTALVCVSETQHLSSGVTDLCVSCGWFTS